MKVITRNAIGTLSTNEAQRGLRAVSESLRLTPPISVKNIIRMAELPPPEIEFFRANPVDVPKDSKTTLSWKVKNCETACNINITAVPPLGPNNPTGFSTKSEGSDQFTVPSNTEYTLSAVFNLGQKPHDTSKTTVTTVTGSSSIHVTNSHNDKVTVFVWLFDQSTTVWEDKGALGFGNSMTIPLQDNHVFNLVCVDTTLIGCDGNDPRSSACQRLVTPPIRGDKDGPVKPEFVF